MYKMISSDKTIILKMTHFEKSTNLLSKESFL